MTPDDGNADTVVPNATPDAGMPVSFECPGCGATLRNIRAVAGEQIRCLNCGTRFSPIPEIVDDTVREKATVVSKVTREPQGAGYWILRIPAMIFAILTALGFVVMVYFIVRDGYKRGFGSNRSDFTVAYLPLLPILGLFAFKVTRTLARIEAATLKAAWNAKLLTEALPMARGSSLPYLIPLAVGPVLIFMFQAVDAANRASDKRGVAAAGAAALVCFALAFMADNLRQFLWRQQAMAQQMSIGGTQLLSSSDDILFPPVAWLPSFTFAAFATAIAVGAFHDFHRRRMDESNIAPMVTFALSVATLFAAVLTVFLLGRNLKEAVHRWKKGAAQLPGSSILSAQMPTFDSAVWLFAAPNYAAAAIGIILVMHALLRDYQPDDFGLYIVFCLSGVSGAIFLGLSLTHLFAEIRAWRKAQAAFWEAHGIATEKIALTLGERVLLLGTLALAAVQSVLYLAANLRMRYRSSSTKEFVGMCVLCFIAHYPILWIVVVTREFFLVDAMARRIGGREGEEC